MKKIILTMLGSCIAATPAFADNGCPAHLAPYEHTVQSTQTASYKLGIPFLNHGGNGSVTTTDKTTICVRHNQAGQAFDQKGRRVSGADVKR